MISRENSETEGFGLGLDDSGVHQVDGKTFDVDGGASLAGYDGESWVDEARACLPKDDDILLAWWEVWGFWLDKRDFGFFIKQSWDELAL